MEKRSFQVNAALVGSDNADPLFWVTQISAYCEGNQRTMSLVYLADYLSKKSANFDRIAFLALIRQGADRRAVFDRLTLHATESQIGELTKWAKANALPEESFSMLTGILAVAPSPSIALEALNLVDEKSSDRSSGISSAARNAAKKGKDFTWIVDFTNGLKPNEIGSAVYHFLAPKVYANGPSELQSVDLSAFPPDAVNYVLKETGRFQGEQRNGAEGYRWAEANYDDSILPYINGLISGWASNDLEGLSLFLSRSKPSQVRDAAAMKLSERLRSLGNNSEADVWGKFQAKVK